jgi:hypothetical protein
MTSRPYQRSIGMRKSYIRPALVKSGLLSAVTAGANFSGKKAKPINGS